MEELLHNLRTVVHSENNIFDTSSNESLNLVYDHGLVAKLNERLGEGKGLYMMEDRISKIFRRFWNALKIEIFIEIGLNMAAWWYDGPFVRGAREVRGTYERAKAGAKTTDKNKSCGWC